MNQFEMLVIQNLEKIVLYLEQGQSPFIFREENPPLCNCHLHRTGESTVGWQCPVHGQMW